MTSVAFPRLVPTPDGSSRFDEVKVDFELREFAPPAKPFGVSPLSDATQCGFLRVPTGFVGEMHPSPLRMWIFVLQGRMRVEAANGEARDIRAGSALLLEDTVGRGHVSRVVGDEDVVLAAVRLPEA